MRIKLPYVTEETLITPYNERRLRVLVDVSKSIEQKADQLSINPRQTCFQLGD